MKKIKICGLIITLILLLEVIIPVISKAEDVIESTNTIDIIEEAENSEMNDITQNEIEEIEETENNIQESEDIENSHIIIEEEKLKDDENTNTLEATKAEENIESKTIDNSLGVEYFSHVQDYGWENEFQYKNGESSGTTGKNKKLEAVRIKLIDAPAGSSIRYRTYLQGIGWQEIKKDSSIAGTTGQNRKIEALQIDLQGLSSYSVRYKVHLENKGWTSWYYDGDIAGAIEEGLKIEAITIEIVPKEEQRISVEYRSHVQDYGWENSYVAEGKTSGTTGKNKKVEATQIKLKNQSSIDSHIKYRVNIEGTGWSDWKYDGDLAGTTGKNKKIYGIRIVLENVSGYSVEYRVHRQDEGWSDKDWVSDGATAGNVADQKKIEALEVKVVKTEEAVKSMQLEYYSHIQDYGWEKEYSNQSGDISGTTGQSKKIEELKIRLINAPAGAKVKYRVYEANQGWKDWKYNGELAGATGQNKKIYGIRIELEGLSDYSVQYKAHIQDIGWSSWKTDGMTAGQPGDEKQIEAVIIRLVSKTTSSEPIVEYYSYVQGSGWEEEYLSQNGEISGTTGKSKSIEGIKIKLRNAPIGASVKYKVHLAEDGWIDKWYKDGETAGVPGSGKKIEAIQVQLENLDKYTIEYKTHVQDYGWQDWRQEGKSSGSTNKNKRIEAFKCRIVGKYKSEFRGIDVSRWNGEIDYGSLITQDNLDFMIIKAGSSYNGFSKDSQFERNYSQAKAYGIPIGVYFYTYATDVAEARVEAYTMLNWLKGKNFELPVFYDMEEGRLKDPARSDINAKMCIEFCNIMASAGYQVGIYTGKYFWQSYINTALIPTNYSIWIASYGTNNGNAQYNAKYAEYHDIWQYTSVGSVRGIDGSVDMNICYNANYFRKK